MTKALFLDRDGVINIDKSYVYKIEDFEFIEGIFPFVRKFQELGYLLIIITNQAGIARDYFTENDYHLLNTWMLNEFKKQDVFISRSYYCPFHPKHGIGKYLKESEDRKPNPGMILKAKQDFNIDLSKSVLIGDKNSDIQAGRQAGISRLIFLSGKYSFDGSEDVCLINRFEDYLLKLI